ncbi:antibiotic biosynthesis monooxygenase family protein [Thalassotalea ganghwensis]
MFAVIFRAKVGQQDAAYSETVKTMRQLAFEKYGCIDFIAVTEGLDEIAISYWESEQAIKDWRNDVDHQVAQKFGKNKWYQSYQVEVAEIKRSYATERTE